MMILTSEQEQSCLNDALAKMVDSGWTPDLILGVSRGGLIPAVIASHKMDLPMIPVAWPSRDYAHLRDTFVAERLHKLGSKHRILVVEELIDTGTSLTELKEVLDDTAHEFKYLTLFQRTTSTFAADYVGQVVDSEEWLEFSWER